MEIYITLPQNILDMLKKILSLQSVMERLKINLTLGVQNFEYCIILNIFYQTTLSLESESNIYRKIQMCCKNELLLMKILKFVIICVCRRLKSKFNYTLKIINY